MKTKVSLLVVLTLTACAAPNIAPVSSQPTSRPTPYIFDPSKTGFSIYQSGKIVSAKLDSGYLTYTLDNKVFEIRTPYKSMRMYISEKDTGEFRQTDKTKFNVLSSALIGATMADYHTLFIADNADPLASNNSIDVYSGLRAVSPSLNTYEVRNFYHLKKQKEIDLSAYTGTLFSYAWVDLNGDNEIGIDEVSRLKFKINIK